MEYDYIIGRIPWPVAAATAIWFGIMAHKVGKNRVLWAIGGGLLGLVVTTIVMGLSQATFIPFSTEAIGPFRLKMAGVAVLIVLCLGWLFTGTLHRRLFQTPQRPATPPPEAPAKTAASSVKP